MPVDLKKILESISGKNLDWFFNDWMASTGKLDYKVCNLTCSEDSFRVTLKNKGDVKGPLVIGGTNDSGDKKLYWMDGFEKKETISLPGKPYSAHLLDPDLWMPEVNRKNNTFRTDGLFRKVEPLQISLLTGNENTSRSRLFVAPAAGWNLYNGVMAGGVIHNVMYPQQKFEFALMPLFAFGTKELAGGGFFSYRIHPIDHWLKEIRWRSGIQHYAYQDDQYVNESKGVVYQSTNHFTRLENRLALTLRNSTPRSRIENSLTLRQVMVIRDLPYGFFYREERYCYDYYQVEFRNSNNHPWNGYQHTASITANKDFVRLWLTGKHLFPYADKKKGIEISGRAGWTSIKSQHAPDVDYRFRLGGWSGKDDYLFDGVFLGRTTSDGIFAQQFLNNDGGFSMNTGYYRLADTWMAAATIKAALPGKLPLSVYSNLATFNGSTKGYSEAQAISMEGGIEIQPIKDIFVIYVPLVYSKDIKYVVDREKLSFGERIRFQLNFNLLNPLEKLND
jgi:hypothetical protein